MTDWNAIYDSLNENLHVLEIKRNPEVTAERYAMKKEAIRWTMQLLQEGPKIGGTSADVSEESYLFGSDYWPAIRQAVLLRDPVCRICGQRPTDEVHHIRPRFLNGKHNPHNLIGLCALCHDEVHKKILDGIQATLESSLDIQASKENTTLDRFMEGSEWQS